MSSLPLGGHSKHYDNATSPIKIFRAASGHPCQMSLPKPHHVLKGIESAMSHSPHLPAMLLSPILSHNNFGTEDSRDHFHFKDVNAQRHQETQAKSHRKSYIS